MRKILLAILFFVRSETGFAQRHGDRPPRPMTKQEALAEERNHLCVRHTFKPFSARLKHYPFNRAAQIQLVAFTGSNPVDPDAAQYADKSEGKLDGKVDSVPPSKLLEIMPLTLLQIDSLTDILYNYGYRGPTRIGSIPLCYDPHNAILFYDNQGKMFAFIEVCFECRKTGESSEEISLGDMCDQKIDMIKQFFKNMGIEYGVTKGPMIDQN
jgi:hypothetical protein